MSAIALDNGMDEDSAPTNSPLQSLTTTPIPAKFESLNIAESKLTLW